ncbi:MAG: hypothetical protein WDM81_12320 [Rhizomicrobium sp.]
MIDVKDEDLGIAVEAQQKIVGIGVERERRAAARGVGAGLDVAQPVDQHAVAQAFLAMDHADGPPASRSPRTGSHVWAFEPSCLQPLTARRFIAGTTPRVQLTREWGEFGTGP